MREALAERYGSAHAAGVELGIPQLRRYCSGEKPFPSLLYWQLAEDLNIDARLVDWEYHASLRGIPEPYPTEYAADVGRVVDRVVERILSKWVQLDPIDSEAELREMFEIRLPKNHFVVAAQLREQWDPLKEQFKRRNPGGLVIKSETVDRLARHLLYSCSVALRSDRLEHACVLMRHFLNIPLPESSPTRLYGLTYLLTLLRKLQRSDKATGLADRGLMSRVMRTPSPSLKSFFLLTYGAALYDCEQELDSDEIYLVCCREAPMSCWSGYAVYNLARHLAKRGDYLSSLEHTRRYKIWKKVPQIKVHCQWLVARTLIEVDEREAALEGFYEIMADLFDSPATPIKLDGKSFLQLMLDSLEAGASPPVIQDQIRAFRERGYCQSAELREALRALEIEVSRADGAANFAAIRSFAST